MDRIMSVTRKDVLFCIAFNRLSDDPVVAEFDHDDRLVDIHCINKYDETIRSSGVRRSYLHSGSEHNGALITFGKHILDIEILENMIADQFPDITAAELDAACSDILNSQNNEFLSHVIDVQTSTMIRYIEKTPYDEEGIWSSRSGKTVSISLEDVAGAITEGDWKSLDRMSEHEWYFLPYDKARTYHTNRVAALVMATDKTPIEIDADGDISDGWHRFSAAIFRYKILGEDTDIKIRVGHRDADFMYESIRTLEQDIPDTHPETITMKPRNIDIHA